MNRTTRLESVLSHQFTGKTSPVYTSLRGLALLSVISIMTSGFLYSEELVNADSVPAGQAKALSSGNPKISSDLSAVVKSLQSKSGKSGRLQTMRQMNQGRSRQVVQLDSKSAEKIQVYLRAKAVTPKLLESIESLGFEVEIISELRPIIQGYAPLDRLNELASLEEISEITRPAYSLATAGPAITEGDVILGTNFIRAGFTFFSQSLDSVDGLGTTVGILSNALYTDEEADQFTSLGYGRCNLLQRNVNTQVPNDQYRLDLPVENFTPLFSPGGSTIVTTGTLYRCPGEATPANLTENGFFGSIDVFPDLFESHILPSSGDAEADDQPFATYPEGAAMMEVIHDIAPSATLLYGDGKTSLGLERSRQFLIPSINQATNFSNSKNVDVIVDNLIFFSEGRYDGSSAISRQSTSVSRTRNIPYFVSAGGQTTTNYSLPTSTSRFPLFINTYFNPDPRSNRSAIHGWSPNTSFDRDELLDIAVTPGQTLEFTLVWDDVWDDFGARATIDFDLYLVPKSEFVDISDAVASSTRTQNGTASNPIEQLIYTVPDTSEIDLGLVIVNRNTGTGSKTLLSLVIENTTVVDSQYLTHGIATNNADALAPVISVGHINIANSISNLSFTNDVLPGLVPGGPSQTSFYSWYENEATPDIISYGSVTTTTTGERGFAGPSSAVAHMAGYAALLRHRFPQMPPQQMLKLMTDTSGLSDTGEPIAQLATDITPRGEFGIDTTSFNKAPVYIRPNTFAIYNALVEGDIDAYGGLLVSSVPLATLEPTKNETGIASQFGRSYKTDWQSNVKSANDELRFGSQGLEIQSSSSRSASWISPSLQVLDRVTNITRNALQPNSEYLLEAVVASSSANPEAIPSFKLKAIDSHGSVFKSMTVNCAEAGFAGSPTSLSGKTYQVYFRTPEKLKDNAELKIVFESVGAETDLQKETTLFLKDVQLTEILASKES